MASESANKFFSWLWSGCIPDFEVLKPKRSFLKDLPFLALLGLSFAVLLAFKSRNRYRMAYSDNHAGFQSSKVLLGGARELGCLVAFGCPCYWPWSYIGFARIISSILVDGV